MKFVVKTNVNNENAIRAQGLWTQLFCDLCRVLSLVPGGTLVFRAIAGRPLIARNH